MVLVAQQCGTYLMPLNHTLKTVNFMSCLYFITYTPGCVVPVFLVDAHYLR